MIEIGISGGFALIDDEDLSKISSMKWRVQRIESLKYAVSNQSKVLISMHRLILGNKDGFFIDHKNGNALDNRKKNLRFCTHAENMRNRKINKNNKSGYKGVFYHQNKWVSQIRVNGKKIYLGRYVDKREAAKAYDQAAKKHFKEFSRLNFN